MKRTLMTVTVLGLLVPQALAQVPEIAPPQGPLQYIAVQGKKAEWAADLKRLQDEWAHIKYEIPGKDAKIAAIHRLEEDAAAVTARFPDSPEVKIWEAIILSTDASFVRGMSVLGKVEKARALLEEALRLNPEALQGAAHVSLGTLYYQVPGWPIAFGDDDKAQEHLEAGLRLNPDGIDPNYFYGDFLMQDGRAAEARRYFESALQAPDRPGRRLADEGRRDEVRAALAKLDSGQTSAGRKRGQLN